MSNKEKLSYYDGPAVVGSSQTTADDSSSINNAASSSSRDASTSVQRLCNNERGEDSTIFDTSGDGRSRASTLVDSRTPSSTTFSSDPSSTTDSKDNNIEKRRSSFLYCQPSKRKVNSLEEFTINRLNFSKLDLYGRETEVVKLNQALEQSIQSKQLVLLSGYSGTGKSRLAKTLKHEVKRMNKKNKQNEDVGTTGTAATQGLYVEGKFDQNVRNNQPYSGIASASAMICAKLLSLVGSGNNADGDQRNLLLFQTIQNRINENLSSEQISLLVKVFPILEEIMLNRENTNQQRNHQNSNPLDTKLRLNYAFCRFIKVIGEFFRPFVWVMDDLQWVDSPSLDLLEAMLVMANRDTPANLLVVGIYRSNEVDEKHILSTSLRDLRLRSAKDQSFGIQEIGVENLDVKSVQKFVEDLLGISGTSNESSSLGLTDIVYKRTHGNVFFLIHFLSLLRREHLLQYNMATLHWHWDEKEIEDQTHATDNVVDILLRKMEDLPKQQVDLLRLAACLGSSFNGSTLFQLWCKMNDSLTTKTEQAQPTEQDNRDEMHEAIQCLVDNGYLYQNEDNSILHFAHDKVEEASTKLTAVQDRKEFYQWVGTTLLTNLDGIDNLESAIFVVTNLLNDGQVPDDEGKKFELAALNCKAAEKAMAVSAFQAAANYVSQGIGFVDKSKSAWETDYELMLNLYSIGAEAESCVGNANQMELYWKEVMANATRSVNDTLRVQATWLDSLANRGAMAEAATQSIQYLKQFNIQFPKNPTVTSLKTLLNIVKAKRGLKGNLLQTILSLPIEKDPTRIKLLHLMDRLTVYLYLSQNDLMPLVMFRNFQWTLKYGLNDVTPSALTTLGLIFAGILDDLQSGAEFGKTALQLIPKVSPLVEGRILFVAHGFVLLWTQPLRDQLKALLRAYEVGLCAGDIESAIWAIYLFYTMRFMTSFSLDLCIADIEVYMPQMKELNQVVAYRGTVSTYQVLMNLAGRTETADNPAAITGEFCAAEDHDVWIKDPDYEYKSCLWQCFTYTIYGEYEKCAKLAVKHGHTAIVKSNPGTCLNLLEQSSKGLSCFIAARQTGNRKYKKIALSIRKRIKGWVEKGNPNVAHLDALFDAEFAALKKKSYAAINSYQVAVVLAARGGLVMDAGMISECFGEYLLDVVGDEEEAKFRLQESIKYYREFGAHRKVQMIETKHRKLWPKPSVILAV